jgi:hypothetical protein
MRSAEAGFVAVYRSSLHPALQNKGQKQAIAIGYPRERLF